MMDERDWQAERFDEHRPHLRAVAYRMLGIMSEADDAVQEAGRCLSRADTSSVENLAGWRMQVVAPRSRLMVLDVSIRQGKIVAIDTIADPGSGKRILRHDRDATLGRQAHRTVAPIRRCFIPCRAMERSIPR
jgi:hypothetical protein